MKTQFLSPLYFFLTHHCKISNNKITNEISSIPFGLKSNLKWILLISASIGVSLYILSYDYDPDTQPSSKQDILNEYAKKVSFQKDTKQKLSLGYSPYHGIFHPTYGPHPTEAYIQKDLDLISYISDHIRIYSASGISYSIVKIASQLNMTVDVGLDLGYDSKKNQDEIENIIKIINDFKDTVHSVVVANDVFLYEKLTDDDLIQIISELRDKLPGVLLTVANPPEGWVDKDKIISLLDYVMINSYPYWWGKNIAAATEWINNEIDSTISLVQNANPKAWVTIGETGWPSDGKTICDAVPSEKNQLEYISQITNLAHQKNIKAIFYGVFNENWKHDSNVLGIEYISQKCGKQSSGTADTEANFGIFKDRKLKQGLMPLIIPIAGYYQDFSTRQNDDYSSQRVIETSFSPSKYRENDMLFFTIQSATITSSHTKDAINTITIQKQDDTFLSKNPVSLPHTIAVPVEKTGSITITLDTLLDDTIKIESYVLPEIFGACGFDCTKLDESLQLVLLEEDMTSFDLLNLSLKKLYQQYYIEIFVAIGSFGGIFAIAFLIELRRKYADTTIMMMEAKP